MSAAFSSLAYAKGANAPEQGDFSLLHSHAKETKEK